MIDQYLNCLNFVNVKLGAELQAKPKICYVTVSLVA